MAVLTVAQMVAETAAVKVVQTAVPSVASSAVTSAVTSAVVWVAPSVDWKVVMWDGQMAASTAVPKVDKTAD
jgi:hypothetical protein